MVESPENLTVVFRSERPELIAVARGVLEDADIPHFTEGEPVAGLAMPVDGMPYVRILVKDSDFDRAREALEEAGLS